MKTPALNAAKDATKPQLTGSPVHVGGNPDGAGSHDDGLPVEVADDGPFHPSNDTASAAKAVHQPQERCSRYTCNAEVDEAVIAYRIRQVGYRGV